MQRGSVTLNGINDAQLIDILQTRDKHGQISFDIGTAKQASAGNPVKVFYNGATINWADDSGLAVVIELLGRLLKQNG